MKRRYYLFPLMAMTALSLSLAACDDNKADDTAAMTETTTEATPVTDTAATTTADMAVINAEGATAYATAEGQTNGAVFLTLHNPQTVSDKLVGASTPVATTVELHQSSVDTNGVATMTKVDAIEVQPGQQVSLKPDGYHIMLMGLTAPLAEGTPFDITLDFETAADVVLPVTVTAPAATTGAAPMEDHSGHSMSGTATETMPMDSTTGTMPVDESPANTEATEDMAPPTTTTAPGDATPDMAPTSSAPDASTTTPSATGQ